MAKRTVTFDDYEEPQYEEYQGEDPPANTWLTAEVVRARYQSDDDQMAFYVSVVDHPDYTGWTRAWYADFEGNLKWKMHDILRALQGGAKKDVTIDWENEKAVENWLKKAKRIRIQTQEYNDRITIRKIRPLVEKVGGTDTKPTAPPPPAPAAEPEELADAYTEEELKDLEAGELEEILQEEFNGELPPKKKNGRIYKASLVTAILEAQEAEDEEGDENDEPEDDDQEFDDGFDNDEDPDADEDEEDDEEEEEPEPAPRRRRGAAKATPAPAAKTTTRRRR